MSEDKQYKYNVQVASKPVCLLLYASNDGWMDGWQSMDERLMAG